MKERFTFSPWELNYTALEGDEKKWYITGPDGNPIARLMEDTSTRDASLLAASRELYDSVRDLLDEFVDGDPEAMDESGVIAAAFKALAKAKGEEPPGE